MVDAVRAQFEPGDEYLIDTIEKLRVVANPLRTQILNSLIPTARTVKEIGDVLGIKSNTLYYHVGELESLGLVTLVDAVVKSGIQHKYYRASGRYFRLLPSLLYASGELAGRQAGANFLAGAVEDGARDLRKALESGMVTLHPEILRVSQRIIRTTQPRAVELRQQVDALERAFIAANDADAPLSVELQFALFPVADDRSASDAESLSVGKGGPQADKSSR